MIKMKSQRVLQIQDKLNRIEEESTQMVEMSEERYIAFVARVIKIAQDTLNEACKDYAIRGDLDLELPKQDREHWEKDFRKALFSIIRVEPNVEYNVKYHSPFHSLNHRKFAAKSLLSKLDRTFETSDDQNKINADIIHGFRKNGQGLYGHDTSYGRYDQLIGTRHKSYREDFFTKDDQELLLNRTMSKEQFENLLFRSLSKILSKEIWDYDESQSDLETSIEEHKNTPYSILDFPIKQKYEVKELTEEEWEEQKEKLWGPKETEEKTKIFYDKVVKYLSRK